MNTGKQRSAAGSVDDGAAYDWHYLCKFILIGDSSVGKSALLLRVTDDRFLAEEAEPTVGVEFGSVTIPLPTSSSAVEANSAQQSSSSSSSSPPERVKVQLWDTAGSEAFRGITRSYYRGAAGCLLVYDVTHRPSFLNAKSWLKDVRDHAEEDACIVLVGNRNDLVEAEDGGDEGKRKVMQEEAKKFADDEGILFIETSAKTGKNVQAAFEQCVSEIHRRFTESQAAIASGKQGSSSASSKANRNGRPPSSSAATLLRSRTGGAGSGSSRGGARSTGEIRLDGSDGEMGRNCCVLM